MFSLKKFQSLTKEVYASLNPEKQYLLVFHFIDPVDCYIMQFCEREQKFLGYINQEGIELHPMDYEGYLIAEIVKEI
jgi:hypothetical protein